MARSGRRPGERKHGSDMTYAEITRAMVTAASRTGESLTEVLRVDRKWRVLGKTMTARLARTRTR